MNMTDVKVLITEDEIKQRIKELAAAMNEYYDSEEVYVICALKGAIIFAADLIRELKMPVKIEFIRLSSYGGNKTSSGKVNSVDMPTQILPKCGFGFYIITVCPLIFPLS